MTESIPQAAERLRQQILEEPTRDFLEERTELLARALAQLNHLEIALDHRTVIGQAAGITMERHQLTPAAAMAVLRRLSQDLNRKMYDLAIEIVAGSPGQDDAPCT